MSLQIEGQEAVWGGLPKYMSPNLNELTEDAALKRERADNASFSAFAASDSDFQDDKMFINNIYGDISLPSAEEWTEYITWLKNTIGLSNDQVNKHLQQKEFWNTKSIRMCIFLHFFRLNIPPMFIKEKYINTKDQWAVKGIQCWKAPFLSPITVPILDRSVTWWCKPLSSGETIYQTATGTMTAPRARICHLFQTSLATVDVTSDRLSRTSNFKKNPRLELQYWKDFKFPVIKKKTIETKPVINTNNTNNNDDNTSSINNNNNTESSNSNNTDETEKSYEYIGEEEEDDEDDAPISAISMKSRITSISSDSLHVQNVSLKSKAKKKVEYIIDEEDKVYNDEEEDFYNKPISALTAEQRRKFWGKSYEEDENANDNDDDDSDGEDIESFNNKQELRLQKQRKKRVIEKDDDYNNNNSSNNEKREEKENNYYNDDEKKEDEDDSNDNDDEEEDEEEVIESEQDKMNRVEREEWMSVLETERNNDEYLKQHPSHMLPPSNAVVSMNNVIEDTTEKRLIWLVNHLQLDEATKKLILSTNEQIRRENRTFLQRPMPYYSLPK